MRTTMQSSLALDQKLTTSPTTPDFSHTMSPEWTAPHRSVAAREYRSSEVFTMIRFTGSMRNCEQNSDLVFPLIASHCAFTIDAITVLSMYLKTCTAKRFVNLCFLFVTKHASNLPKKSTLSGM